MEPDVTCNEAVDKDLSFFCVQKEDAVGED